MANNPLGSTENLLRGGNAMCHLDGGMPTFALEHSQSHIPAQHHHAHSSYPDFGQMHMRQGQEQQAHLQPGQHLPGLGSMNKLDQLPAAHQQHANLPGHPPQFAYMPGMTMDQLSHHSLPLAQQHQQQQWQQQMQMPPQHVSHVMPGYMDTMGGGGSSWPGQPRHSLSGTSSLTPHGLLFPPHQGQKPGSFSPAPTQYYTGGPYQFSGIPEGAQYSYQPQMQAMGGGMYPLHHQVHPGMHMHQAVGDESGGSDPRYGTKPDLRATKKPRLVWTPELHARFEKAINKLSPDRANPKSIMIEMNVEGLVRANVASHLQKYRLMQKRDASRASRAIADAAEQGGQATPPSASTDNTTASGGNKVAQEYKSGNGVARVEHTSGQTKDAEQCSSGNVVAKAERTSGQTKVADQCNDVAKAERTSGQKRTAEECNGVGAKADSSSGQDKVPDQYKSGNGIARGEPTSGLNKISEHRKSGNGVSKAEHTSAQNKVAEQCNGFAKAEPTSGQNKVAEQRKSGSGVAKAMPTSAQNKAAEQCSGDAKANPGQDRSIEEDTNEGSVGGNTQSTGDSEIVAKTEPDEDRSNEEGINEGSVGGNTQSTGDSEFPRSGNCVAKTEPDEGRSDEEGINEGSEGGNSQSTGGDSEVPESKAQPEKALSGGLGTQDAGVEGDL